jgi:iron complex transport system ATP-binding protein
MGYVPASTNDTFSMTVLDTILMGRHPHQKVRATREDLHIAYDIMRKMNILHLAMRNFDELSAGQHQKVAIARGLAQEPRILILDEPTSNLDIRHQMQTIEILRELAVDKGIMVLMISHDLNLASMYADKIIVMSTPGVIHRIGTPEDVINADMIRYVYGVESEIVMHKGRPHVILDSILSNEEIRELHSDETIMPEYLK